MTICHNDQDPLVQYSFKNCKPYFMGKPHIIPLNWYASTVDLAQNLKFTSAVFPINIDKKRELWQGSFWSGTTCILSLLSILFQVVSEVSTIYRHFTFFITFSLLIRFFNNTKWRKQHCTRKFNLVLKNAYCQRNILWV